MHLGIARTFLGAWLDARAHGGRILLRIEDVDTVRARPESPAAIMRDLEWLGLGWDEGPVYQHDRFDRYAEVLTGLERRGRAFPCSCTRRELGVASAPHGPEDEGPRYPGTCLGGPTHPQRRWAIRFRTHPGDLVDFVDARLGRFSEDVHARVGDFVLRRSDGLYAYQLAVAVDDLDQGITRIVRGVDLLGSSARQLLLRRTIHPEAPDSDFLHLPLLLGPGGERLATRQGAKSIEDFRSLGRTPAQVVGALAASLGLVPAGTELPAEALVPLWRPEALAEAPLDPALA